MNKLVKKNNDSLINIIIIVALLLIMIAFLIYRGTFGLDEVNKIVVECPNELGTDNQVTCDITMYYDTDTYNNSNKVLSANANFNLTGGLEYVSFVPSCTDCEINEYTENGFAVGRLAGLSNEFILGQLTVSIPDVNAGVYTVGLINVEYSLEDETMLTLDDNSTQLVFGSPVPTVSPMPTTSPMPTASPNGNQIIFDETLHVDGTNNIVYDIVAGTRYSELLAKIYRDEAIPVTIVDNKGNAVSSDTLIKNNDTLTFALAENVTYTMSVFGDLNNDGKIGLGDVRESYRLYKNSVTLSTVMKYTADTNKDGKNLVTLGDFRKEYFLYKN